MGDLPEIFDPKGAGGFQGDDGVWILADSLLPDDEVEANIAAHQEKKQEQKPEQTG